MKYKITLAVVIFFAFTTRSTAQEFQWGISIGASSGDGAYDICVDSYGNSWAVGSFFQTADFDDGPGTVNLTGTSVDGFIVKTDSAGNFLWATDIGSNNGDMAHSICADNDGNVYVTGYFGNTVDMDPGPGVINLTAGGTTYDIFVLKLDQDGNAVWAKGIGSSDINGESGWAIEVGDDGAVYVGGDFSGTVDFDPGPAVFNMTAFSQADAFILKLDANGNFLWAKCWGTPLDVSCVQSIRVIPSGKILMTGYFGQTVDFNTGPGVENHTSNGDWDAYILQLDTNGTYDWVKTTGGPQIEVCENVDVDSDGNIYAVGRFMGNTDFDPGSGVSTMNAGGDVAGYLQKLDQNGNFLWAEKIGTAGFNRIYRVEIDEQDEVYLAGEFAGTVDFDFGSSSYALTASGDWDIFLLKTDTNGSLTWVRRWDSNYAQQVAIRNGEEVYIAGSFLGGDFDPGPSVENHSSYGMDDIFVIKLHDICNLTANVEITSSIYTLSADIDDAAYQWYDCVKGQPVVNQNSQDFNLIENGSFAVIVTKEGCIDTSDCYGVDYMSLREEQRPPILLFPNPANEQLSIQLTAQSTTIHQVIITNPAGSEVKNITVENANEISFAISDLAPGAYVVRVLTSDGVYQSGFLVME